MTESQEHNLTLRMTAMDLVIQMGHAGLLPQVNDVVEVLKATDAVKDYLSAGGNISTVVQLTRIQ